MRTKFSLILLFCLFLFPSFALSQATGRLDVNIIDSELRSPITGASVVMFIQDQSFGLLTDGEGKCSFYNCPPSIVELWVYYIGYIETNIINVPIYANVVNYVLISLEYDE